MRREKRKRIKRQSDKILGILFISCLFIIMILNLMTKDKKISEEEKQNLDRKAEVYMGQRSWRNLYAAI